MPNAPWINPAAFAEEVAYSGNPYSGRPDECLEPHQPALSLLDLDRLVAARLQDERRAAAERQRLACEAAWDEGHKVGYALGFADSARELRHRIGDVLSRRLIHVERRLALRGEQPKSTIAHERELMAREAVELNAGIKELADV